MRRIVDDLPWALSLVWLPAGLGGPELRPAPDVSLASPGEQRPGLRRVPADGTVTPAPAAPSDSEPLDVAPGTPLIVLSGGDVDQHGRRIAQVAHRIRGEPGEIAIDIPGDAA